MMRERPILFSAPMVRAILDGRKPQTRRVMNPQPTLENVFVGGMHRDAWVWKDTADPAGWLMHRMCPYGQPGDRLWVRETFFDTDPFKTAPIFAGRANRYAYRADDEVIGCHKWKPAIHMPRAASRILLEVSAVRVERLQDISEADAIAEGIARIGDGWERFHVDPDAPVGQPFTLNPVLSYRGLWESINGAGCWDANPWVWVIEFRRAQR